MKIFKNDAYLFESSSTHTASSANPPMAKEFQIEHRNHLINLYKFSIRDSIVG